MFERVINILQNELSYQQTSRSSACQCETCVWEKVEAEADIKEINEAIKILTEKAE